MRPVRVTTIVWGAILLVVSGVAIATLATPAVDQGFPAWVAVALGGLFVVAALAGAIARAVKPPMVEPTQRVEPVETPTHQPVD